MSKLGLQARLQLLGPLPKRPARLRRQARPPAPALHPVLVGQLLELSGLVQVRHIRVRKISNFKFQISNWSSFFGFPAVSRAFIRPTPLFTRQCVMIDLVPMQYVLVAYWYADWCLQSDVICDLYTCSGRRRSRGPGSSCRTTRTSSLRSSLRSSCAVLRPGYHPKPKKDSGIDRWGVFLLDSANTFHRCRVGWNHHAARRFVL